MNQGTATARHADRKARIGAAFDAAAPRYERAAAPQRAAAALLADFAARQCPADPARILELGCGTGLLTRAIRARWPGAAITASDIAPRMIAHAAADPALAGVAFRRMDGEAPDGAGAPFDLILANLVVQWFADLDGALARLVPLLAPRGHIAFSTMGARSFAAWRAAHAACGLPCAIPPYRSHTALVALAARHGAVTGFERMEPLPGSGARALITHLRGIGATVAPDGARPLPPADLRRVMAAFDAAGGEDAYHLHFLCVSPS